jgi:CDP-glycerol glycerophosphotransferase (TagB/SpsB family)
MNIGIIIKPHPRDQTEYKDMIEYENIFLAGKYDDIYEIFKIADIHSTVYSTSSLEALAFGKPNIFINVGINIASIFDIIDEKSCFMVSKPDQYIEILKNILKNYENAKENAIRQSKKFFKPNAKENTLNTLKSLKII